MSLDSSKEPSARSDRADKLLIGLGNPGPKYAATRHNFGFLLLDRVAGLLRNHEKWRLKSAQEQPGLGRWEQFEGESSSVHLLWPLTFMNLSGQAVIKVLEALQDPPLDTREDILVAMDDLSLPLGRVRLRAKGSSGGHNGLKSIEAHLGHDRYPRLKLGIGRPDGADTVVDFVLEPFSSEEKPVLEEVLDFIAPHALRWLEGAEIPELSQVINGWSALEAVAGEGCAKAE